MMNNPDRLEQHLMSLSGATQYPPTPDLAATFWQQLETSPTRRPAPRLAFAGAALAAVALALALTFAFASPARDAAADLFHRINIFESGQDTTGLTSDIPGVETTLGRAETAVGTTKVTPMYPDGVSLTKVLLADYRNAQTAALFYENDRESFVLFVSNVPVAKGPPFGGTITVDPVYHLGDQAFWLTGRRVVESIGADGRPIVGTERVVDANTLVWQEGNVVYRIEGNISEEEAARIAQSVR